jgi:GTPase SAR1 family protein
MKKNSSDENNLNTILKNLVHFKKINLIGNMNVGKTNLTKYLGNYQKYKIFTEKCEENNNKDTEQFLEKIEKVTLKYNDRTYKLNIYETNCDNINITLSNLDTLLLYSDCIVFMVDITNKDSHDNVIQILKKLFKNKNPYIPPIFYILNKLDCEDEREVYENDINELNNYNNIIKYEISLKVKKNCEEFFEQFVYILDVEPKSTETIKLVQLMNPPKLTVKIKADDIYNIKIYLFGPSGVGKSCLFKKFLENEFINSVSTCSPSFNEIVLAKIKDNKIKVSIWDTSGQETFKSVIKSDYCKADGILLLFDITQNDTFLEMKTFIEDIRSERGTNDPKLYFKKTKDEII